MHLNIYNIHFLVGLFVTLKDVKYFANIERDIDTSGILTLDYGTFKAVSIVAKDCGAPFTITIQGNVVVSILIRHYLHLLILIIN